MLDFGKLFATWLRPQWFRAGKILGCTILIALLLPQSMLPAQSWTEPEDGSAGTWLATLPADLRASILWSADYETGNLDQWSIPTSQSPGGGVLNTDDENVVARGTQQVVHSGRFAGEATIRNAIRAANGKKAVRLMRWATDAYDRGGVELPLAAYYGTWMYLPEAYDPAKQAPWDPGDGGWWNVFQFKSHDANDQSQSTWSMNIEEEPQTQQLFFYLYSPINQQKSWEPYKRVPIPVNRWFHIEAFVKVNARERGRIEVWLNGESIIRAENVRTSVNPQEENIVWGIGNYTDHIAGGKQVGTATVYFDDSTISTRPLAPLVRRDAPRGDRGN